MESIGAGELVKVADDGPELDGIVFDTPSSSKVIVAVIDRVRGPVFRTVHPSTLSPRTEESRARCHCHVDAISARGKRSERLPWQDSCKHRCVPWSQLDGGPP